MDFEEFLIWVYQYTVFFTGGWISYWLHTFCATMDPIHLRPSELDYELRIRGIVGLSNIRTGTKTIRDILKKEALGIEVNPSNSGAAFPVGDELIECRRMIKSINESIDIAQQNHGSLLWVEAEHRILHLKGRLKRIHVLEAHDSERLRDLLVDCDNLVRRIADGGRPSVENRISFNVPSEGQRAEVGQTALPPRLSTTRSGAPTRVNESVSEPEDFLGFSQGAANLLSRSTGVAGGGRGRGRGTTRSSMQQAEGVLLRNGMSRAPTPPQFSGRVRIPMSDSVFDLDPLSNANDNQQTVRPQIVWENELRSLGQRESQTARVHLSAEDLLNDSLANMNLGREVPTYNRDSNTAWNTQVRTGATAAPSQQTNAQPSAYREHSRRNSNPDASAGENNAAPRVNRTKPSESQPRDESQNQRENGPPPSAFVNRLVPNQFVNQNSYNFSDETCVRPDRDAIFRNLNASDRRNLSVPIMTERTNAQATDHSQFARAYSNPNVYPDTEEVNLGPSYSRRGQNVIQPRDERVFANYAPDRYCNNYVVPDQFEAYRPAQRQSFEPQVEARQQRLRSFHKSVPVNHWKVSFSGDGQGLHLFDFLSQVRMLQRSEMIPDQELLPMMVHLFTGRAKNWYGSLSGTIRTWDELVDALRAEFLPENYDFMMLDKITNRKQRSTESVGEFLALMQAQFMWLGVPLAEPHKVFIVRNNLLPKYAQGVAPFEVRSLEELGRVCKRIESSTVVSLGLPFESQNYTPSRHQNRTRAVNEIEEPADLAEAPCHDEVCALRRGVRQSKGASICYNCNKGGHLFRDCKEPRGGLFCYGCGIPDVTTRTCSKCAGNANRSSASQEGQQGSAASSPTAQESRPTDSATC